MKYLYLSLAALLLLCLLHMPYGFYTLVRFIAMIGFGVIAVKFFNEENVPLAVAAGTFALLFQPFIKIHLGRMVWNVVDVVVALLLIALTVYEAKREK